MTGVALRCKTSSPRRRARWLAIARGLCSCALLIGCLHRSDLHPLTVRTRARGEAALATFRLSPNALVGVGDASELGPEWDQLAFLRFPARSEPYLFAYSRQGLGVLRPVRALRLQSPVGAFSQLRRTFDSLTVIERANSNPVLLMLDRQHRELFTYTTSINGGLELKARQTLHFVDVLSARIPEPTHGSVERFDRDSSGKLGSEQSAQVVAYGKQGGELRDCTLDFGSFHLACSPPLLVEKHWDQIFLGDFHPDLGLELLLWSRQAHTLSLAKLDRTQLRTTALYYRSDLPFRAHRLLEAGYFDEDRFLDLVIFDPNNQSDELGGQAELHLNDGWGHFRLAQKTPPNLRRTWTHLLRVRPESSPTDELFLYDNTLWIKLLFVTGANDDGSHQVSPTRQFLSEQVADANQAFASAGIRFKFEQRRLVNTELNQLRCGGEAQLLAKLETLATLSRERYRGVSGALPPLEPSDIERASRVLIYMPDAMGGGGCSSAASQHILMGNRAARGTLVHELGHYFSLDHTFSLSRASALQAAFDRGVRGDLPAAAAIAGSTLDSRLPGRKSPDDLVEDPTSVFWMVAYEEPHKAYCDPNLEVPFLVPSGAVVWVNPDRFNAMNYRNRYTFPSPYNLTHLCPYFTFTRGQATAMRDFLFRNRFGKGRLIR